MRLQLYISPVLSDRLYTEAAARQMTPRELADQILKDYFGITDKEENYQTSLAMVINEVNQFLSDENAKGTFTLLDFDSFRSIGTSALRSAVGRGIAKYLKGREDVVYCRDENGNICRTNNHAAIYKIISHADGQQG